MMCSVAKKTDEGDDNVLSFRNIILQKLRGLNLVRSGSPDDSMIQIRNRLFLLHSETSICS